MKKVLGRAFGLALGLALILSMVLISAVAAVTYPCVFWGFASVGGVNVTADTEITAWVGAEQIGWALTGAGGLADNEFAMGAEYDETAGDEVSFKIGDLWAHQTATWERYGSVRVDLTATAPGAVVAEAGGPYSGVVGESVHLHGSAIGGTPPYSYAWDLDYDGYYDDSYVQNPSWTWYADYVYMVGLRVTDYAEAWDTDTASVSISPVPPPPAGVGGTPYPPNKFAILAPWIALGLGLIAAATIVMRRRRLSH